MISKLRLKSPYPWFGGKKKIASVVWEAFGRPKNYVEPFFGGGAVLLARPNFDPENPPLETVNDINAWVCNFWRAVRANPNMVAAAADWPVSELDLHARGDALFYKGVILAEKNGKRLMKPDEFAERLRGDPEWYDSKIAGWWVWGQSSWIGDAWGREECRAIPCLSSAGVGVHRKIPILSGAGAGVNRSLPSLGDAGRGVHRKIPILSGAGAGVNRSLPSLSSAGGGVNRQRPHLGDAGVGVNRQIPILSSAGGGVNRQRPHICGESLREYLRQLSVRLRRVRVCCGDWMRVMGPCVTTAQGMTAVFLDPPYAVKDRDSVYGEHDSFTLAHDVRKWCMENGGDPLLRIALCGYEGEHNELEDLDWRAHCYSGPPGYGNQKKDKSNLNHKRETVWFSPACFGKSYNESDGSIATAIAREMKKRRSG